MQKYITLFSIKMKKILFILILIIGLASCENDMEDIRFWDPFQDIPTEIAKNVEMLYSDSMQVRIIVKAPLLERYGGAEAVEYFNEGLIVDFLNDDLEISSRLTANYAEKRTINIIDELGRTIREPVIIIKRNVVFANGAQDTLKTEELIWFENQGKLASDKFVTIIRQNELIWGNGFDTDRDFERWRIRSVVGRFNADNLNSGLKD